MSAQPNHSFGPVSATGIGTMPAQAGVVQSLLVTGGQGQGSSPALQQSLAAQQQLIGGVVVVPSLSSPQVIQPGRPSQPVIVQPVLQGRDVNELQILRAQVQQQHGSSVLTPLGTSATVASATGSTIHHLGHSPMSRGGAASPVPPLANPFQQQFMMSGKLQDQLTSQPQSAQLPGIVSQLSTQACQQQVNSVTAQIQQRRASGPRITGMAVMGTPTELSSQNKSYLTSPLLSPERVRKRLKVEEKPAPTPELQAKRKHICDYKLGEMACLKESYKENLTELFFLQNGGNLMDFFTWKKRPSVQLIHFLKSGSLDSDDEEENSQEKSINNEVKVLTASGGTAPLTTPVAIATALPVSVAAAQQQQDQNKRPGGRHGMVFGHIQLSQPTQAPQMPGGIPLSTTAATTTVGSPAPYTSAASTPVNPTTASTMISTTPATVNSTASTVSLSGTLVKMMMEGSTSPLPGVNDVHTTNSLNSFLKSPASPGLLSARQHSLSAVYDNTVGSQEAIVERAKQEAQVLQRVAELRKEGLWSSRRLPKVQEPSRNKAHWDYLLEEMQWLAADFAQERKWKKAGARKIARMITRYFQELQQKEIRAEKEEGMRLKRIASNLAKMVKEFWSNIEKVVQYKQQSRLEEKRKKALDLHLSFIVDQTEKYSSWLTEGLSAVGPASSSSKAVSVCSPQHNGTDDGEFEPSESGVDDEETIDQAEAEVDDEDSTRDEIDALKRESELPLEELLKTLPKEVFEKPASLEESEITGSGDETDDSNLGEFKSDQEDSADDEDTLEEQEKHEKSPEHEQELKELQAEGELSVDEIRKKYAAAYESDFEDQLQTTSAESEEEDTASDITEEEEDTEQEDMETEDEESEEVGIDYLTKNLDVEEPTLLKESSKPNKEITDIAAAAQSIQPTGYTLETTQVKTKVPFLLKHKLREYQHVGLDWLATLHERKLNGILADEMGLGKTIQTIAVLAHLATEWGVWGPHLIVVPTSVMLNWEMELKKWCPAFKILTYYGNQKERKLKRQGWTKTNAFHICITSYKLVIQDHQSFRRKKWKYLILDEAQNIKNFKSQRWQTLLNFSSQRRLLLTGTPLQNNLMELWSLMHFLMPHIFQSHKEFKEWFANPLSGMIEGNHEYNEQLIKRLHKVLRPFLLRRLKQDVEKQMPKKYEHVVMCHLSKRQRYLYDDFMSQAKTKETLATGHFMSVINILMQLRKVCNHPNLFDPRPIQSPFQMEGLVYNTPSLVLAALRKDPLETIDLADWRLGLAQAEMTLSSFSAQRIKQLQTPCKLIEEIDTQPDPDPRLPPLAEHKPFVYRNTSPLPQTSGRSSPFAPVERKSVPANIATATCTIMSTSLASSAGAVNAVSSGTDVISSCKSETQLSGDLAQDKLQTLVTTTAAKQVLTSHPITLQIQQTQQGTRLMIPSGSLPQLPAGLIQIVQTSGCQQLITASSQYLQQSTPTTASVVSGPSITVSTVSTTSTVSSVTRPVSTVTLPISSQAASNGKPVVKVLPMVTEASATPASPVSTEADIFTSASVMATCSPGSEEIGTSSSLNSEIPQKMQSVFYLPSLAEKKRQLRQEVLKRLAFYNQRNCDVSPVMGQDVHNVLAVTTELPKAMTRGLCLWLSLGFVHCCRVTKCNNPWHPDVFWNQTSMLRQMVHSPEQYMLEMKELLDRFVIICPPVTAPMLQLHCSHPSPSWLQEQKHREFMLKQDLGPRAACLHNISTRMTVQFPELRLIEYDCGKLQTLDLLLARLKAGDHRVLIFTQMTRMLDILEQFLSYHGHRYLRLDGTTKVEQRQILMDRFNMDKRIFCFILSTRSGGLGVNLTGADTVIFYDSDWNPTMDAQAQDRCHRIGQTRDVHIYRLISEMTVEENILKKANQKRLLGDVAIEGGNFTAAFFKQQTIKELFEEPSGLQSLTEEQKKAPIEKQEEVAPNEGKEPDVKADLTEEQLEQALCAAEDETDIQAANVVKAEQKAELAEFDENIPWDEREAELKREKDEELSKVEQELAMLEKELTPVERYAVTFVEEQIAPVATEELEKAEEEVTIAKEEWELSRLQALKEEEERRAELEEDEVLYTYSREDAYSQVKKGKKGTRVNHQTKSVGSRNSILHCTEGIMDKEIRLLREKEEAENARAENAARNNVSTEHDSLGKSNSPVVQNGRAGKKALAGRVRHSSVNSISSECSINSVGSVKKMRLSLERCDSIANGKSTKEKKDRRHSLSGAKKSVAGPSKTKLGKTAVKKPAKSNDTSPGNKANRVKRTKKKAVEKEEPCQPGVSVAEPWSNPNLVIRTRRASVQSPVHVDQLAENRAVQSQENSLAVTLVQSRSVSTVTSLPQPILVTSAKSSTGSGLVGTPLSVDKNSTPNSSPLLENKKVGGGLYVIVSRGSGNVGQALSLTSGHSVLQGNVVRYMMAGTGGKPVLQAVKQVSTLPQSVVTVQPKSTVVSQTTTAQTVQVKQQSTGITRPHIILKQVQPAVGASQPQVIQLKQLPQTRDGRVTHVRTVRQVTPSQLAQLRALGHFKPGQHMAVKAVSPSIPSAPLRFLSAAQSAQVSPRLVHTQQLVSQTGQSQGQQVLQNTVPVHQVISNTTTVPGQSFIVTPTSVQQGQHIICTAVNKPNVQPRTIQLGQQVLSGDTSQTSRAIAQPTHFIIQSSQGSRVVQQLHQVQVVSPQSSVLKTTSVAQLQASKLAQLRLAMQQTRTQMPAVQQTASSPGVTLVSGSPQKVLSVPTSTRTKFQSVGFSPNHRTVQPNNTIPILEKLAKQLADGPSILNAPVQSVTRSTTLLGSHPVQIVKASNVNPLSLSQITLSGSLVSQSNAVSTSVNLPTNPIMVQQLGKPVIISKLNGDKS